MNILYDWLNNEVKLSIKITNIESQFSNGYYFGELLYLFHQQLDFMEKFRDSHLKQSMAGNFILIEPTLSNLGVAFNSNDAKDIIEQKEGKAIWLLRQLKDCLARLSNPVDISILKSTGRKNQTLPLKKINMNHSKKRSVESKLFAQRLHQILESEKSKDMRQHLQCFEDYGRFLKGVQREKVRKESKVQELLMIQKRLLKINQLKRYLQFKNAWDNKSKKQWHRNMENRREFIEIVKKIKKQKVTTENKRREEMKRGIKQQTFQSMEDFEGRLKSMKLKKEGNSETEEESMTMGFFNQIVQMGEYTGLNPDMSKIVEKCKEREKDLHSEEFKKERDKRIRKMIVDLKKNKLETDFQTAKNKLLEKLTLESRQEEEIRYEIYKTKKLKEIFKKNREARDECYLKRFRDIQGHEQKRNRLLFRKLKENVGATHELLQNRVEVLDKKYLVDNHDRNYRACRGIVDLLLDYSEQIYQRLQIFNNDIGLTPIFKEKEQLYFKEARTMMPLAAPESREPNPLTLSLSNIDFKNYLKEFKKPVTKSENPFLCFLTSLASHTQQHPLPIVEEPAEAVPVSKKVDFDDQGDQGPPDETIKRGMPIVAKKSGEPSFGEHISPIQSNQNNMMTVKPKQIKGVQKEGMLHSIVNASFLGESGQTKKALSSSRSTTKQMSPFEYLPLKVCLLGINKEVKTTLERFLAHKFDLKVFRADEQVNSLMIRANEDADLLFEEERAILHSLHEGKTDQATRSKTRRFRDSCAASCDENSDLGASKSTSTGCSRRARPESTNTDDGAPCARRRRPTSSPSSTRTATD